MRIVPMLVMSLFSFCTSSAQNQGEEVRFTATVQSIAPDSRPSGKMIRIGKETNFVVTVRLELPDVKLKDLSPGGVLKLAIHSPSILFQGQPPEGKRYDFRLRLEMENGKSTYCCLEARELQKVNAELSGKFAKWLNAAAPEFHRRKLNLDNYNVSIGEEGDSVNISLTAVDAVMGGRGSSGSYPGFVVVINKRNLRIARSYFVR